MNPKPKKTIILVVSVLILVFIMPIYSFAKIYDRTFTLDVQYGYYLFSHTVYVSAPPSLYDYYHGKSHRVYSDGDYAKFVTPNAVKPIAESIQNGIGNRPYRDEEFANAVLIFVRQISYVKGNVKYPVETLVDNSGDCDVLSLLAASIMKAGGLDVVLLHYENSSPSHMNVGVYLPYNPVYNSWWMSPVCYEYNSKKYWMAECTSKGDWKVGDRPELLVGVTPQIISLEKCEKSSPAEVSSSLDSPLIASHTSITVSSHVSSAENRTRTLKISGSISPSCLGKSVVMYVSKDGSSFDMSRTVVTDSFGKYSFNWDVVSMGTYYIKTSWSGSSNYAGSDSETLTVFVGPKSFVQFETPDYNYILGRAVAAPSESRNMQGIEEFLSSNLTGTGVLITGEFIILRSEQTISNVQTKIVTIPKSEQTIIVARQTMKILIPERTITITRPIDIPIGMEPLILPDNFNQTINNQFGFILKRIGENNYSVNVRGLDYYDIHQIIKLSDENTATFMNASMVVRENTWYNMVARMSQDEITAELFDGNDALLKNIAIKEDAVKISEFGIILTNSTDAVIAFKNLKIGILDQSGQPISGNNILVGTLEWRRGG
jgi:hypothetical protein